MLAENEIMKFLDIIQKTPSLIKVKLYLLNLDSNYQQKWVKISKFYPLLQTTYGEDRLLREYHSSKIASNRDICEIMAEIINITDGDYV